MDLATKLGSRFSEFSREDVVRLRAVGFINRQILECEVVTALNNFAIRDIEHLPIEEIAQQLGLSVPTVKVRLLRGTLMLREWLAPLFARGPQ